MEGQPTSRCSCWPAVGSQRTVVGSRQLGVGSGQWGVGSGRSMRLRPMDGSRTSHESPRSMKTTSAVCLTRQAACVVHQFHVHQTV